MEIVLKGLIAGFIIAVPLGPVSVLCFRRVLTERLLAGLFTVFGAAAADTLYGLIAALGITAITHQIQEHRFWLRIFAGLFLLYFGTTMIRAHPSDKNGGQTGSALGLMAAFWSAFGLMIVNPVVIFSFFGVFAWLDLSAHQAGFDTAARLAVGLFAGSSAWWLVYKLAFQLFGEKLRKNGIHQINLAAGALVCIFGGWELFAALFRHR
jgi:threonine/homoserine/homoserine lactone efflux protein